LVNQAQTNFMPIYAGFHAASPSRHEAATFAAALFVLIKKKPDCTWQPAILLLRFRLEGC
jgi:hypothetical protein